MSDRGFVLIPVLWLAMLLGVVAGGITVAVHSEALLARHFATNTTAEFLADAGVVRAMIGLGSGGSKEPWVSRGEPFTLDLGEGYAQIAIEDEDGKIDLNLGSTDALRAILELNGIEQGRASRTVERISALRLSRRSMQQGNNRASNDRMGTRLPDDTEAIAISEIGYESYGRVRSFVTIYSKIHTFDPTTSRPEVESVMHQSAGRPGISPSRQTVYTIRSLGCHPTNQSSYERVAVVRRSRIPGKLFTILSWRHSEGASELSCSSKSRSRY